MKIRTGFVANSSSSSFIIAGLEFEYCEEEVIKLFKKHNIDYKTLPYSDEYKTLEDYIKSDLYCSIEELAEAIGMDYKIDSESEVFYIGFDLKNSKINEVIKSANKAKEVFGDDVSVHSVTIYN